MQIYYTIRWWFRRVFNRKVARKNAHLIVDWQTVAEGRYAEGEM